MDSDQFEPRQPLRIGISACLLGQEVRYDGRHKRDDWLAGQLPERFQLVPVCPEVAIGLGVPREPIQLVGAADDPRVLGSRTPGLDVTEPLVRYGRRMAEELADISGYVFKSKSPSCGLWRVKVQGPDGRQRAVGRGVYAREFGRALPLLPMEEEARLGDALARENFLLRVYGYARWRRLLELGPTHARLQAFHAAHKLILMACSRPHLTRLGRLLAQPAPAQTLARDYGAPFMEALARGATRGRHVDVLQHLQGYLKRALDAPARTELEQAILAYQRGELEREAVLALLRAHFRRHPDPYVAGQLYLYGALGSPT